MRTLDYGTCFIELANTINHERPYYVVQRTEQALIERGHQLAGANILVLGVTYKSDIDDARETPAQDIMAALAHGGANVTYSDPQVEAIAAGGTSYTDTPLTAERLAEADCVLLVTNHRDFDYGFIARHARLIVDTRNAFKGVTGGNAEIVRL